jgi:hypothetical protein
MHSAGCDGSSWLGVHWLKNLAVTASLFYVHFATQVWVFTAGL